MRNTEVRRFVIACEAMKSRFELVLVGRDETFLRSVGQEAIAEIQALDRQMNFFSPTSEITHINREAAYRAVRVEPQLFSLLVRCDELWKLTDGAFDPTLQPLLDAWGWSRREGKIPDEPSLELARAKCGMDKVELIPDKTTIRFLREGMSLNLGSVGKGYALDRVREILKEFQIGQALVHGGGSSIMALGCADEGAEWQVGISDPSEPERHIARACMLDESLGVSANNLNYLSAEGVRIGHVLDPRNGRPVGRNAVAAVICSTAADADAFSTALLCQGMEEATWLGEVSGALLAREVDGELRIDSKDIRGVEGRPIWALAP